MTRVAVVGHVEWVDFLNVPGFPGRGQITPAQRVRSNAAGGAVVAAAVLAELGASVDFFGAVGSDELGRRAEAELSARGIVPWLARRSGEGTREVITLLEPGGERSIVVIGARLAPSSTDSLPWDRLAQADGVYVTAAGDPGALEAARRARVLVASPRIAERVDGAGGVDFDALVWSADDAAEVAWAAALAARTRLAVVTDGGLGGHWQPGGLGPARSEWGAAGGGSGASGAGPGASGAGAAGAAGGRWSSVAPGGRWSSVAPGGPIIDTYGAGDSFAAGFTFGLASSGDPAVAARIGAECGARALTHPGGP